MESVEVIMYTMADFKITVEHRFARDITNELHSR